jgi:hypothetical protein
MRTVGGQAKGLRQKETVKGCVEEDMGVQLGLEKCCGGLGKGREGDLRGGGGVISTHIQFFSVWENRSKCHPATPAFRWSHGTQGGHG